MARDPGSSILLLDIEGTTTPVDFVYQTLFPFARQGVKDYLRTHIDDPQVQADLRALQQEHTNDLGRELQPPAWDGHSADATLHSAVAYIGWLMDRDRKSTPLKSLQGRIWQAGYAGGKLKGAVYPEVRGAFERWHNEGNTIAIFSSGSVLAQQLLFANSTAGDLTPFIKAHFDTTTGPKSEARSYHAIAAALGVAPAAILFVSDVVTELNAARAAGMRTALCIRPRADAQDQQVRGVEYPVIRDFDQLVI